MLKPRSQACVFFVLPYMFPYILYLGILFNLFTRFACALMVRPTRKQYEETAKTAKSGVTAEG